MTLRSILGKITGAKAYRAWVARRRTELQFEQEFKVFKKMSQSGEGLQRFSILWENRWPCLEDKTTSTEFNRHYVYHPAWAARIVAKNKPIEHIDISSTLHFCSILSAFVPVRFYDYRPADLQLDNFVSSAADLLKLPFPDDSILSLSCMHVVEHVGLGRYGDPMDPDGDLKAMKELTRVLAPGGSLLFVVPVGISRICFNAHRLYSFHQVREAFRDLELKEFALIPDDPALGGLVQNAPPALVDSQNHGCGCFWFFKPV